MPEGSIPANVVYQVIKDLRELDSRPVLNLASFVTTYMEDEARQLMMDSLDINFVDTDEYVPLKLTSGAGYSCRGVSDGLLRSPLTLPLRTHPLTLSPSHPLTLSPSHPLTLFSRQVPIVPGDFQPVRQYDGGAVQLAVRGCHGERGRRGRADGGVV